MSGDADPNPRKKFDEAVSYAVQIANGVLRKLETHDISLSGLRYLELGPGADFAPQLILVSHGVRVTLADKYLSQWDPGYHPGFYRAFLEQWPGRKEAIEIALKQGGYDGLLKLVSEPVEEMASLAADSFDLVLSNAVLEHVLDIPGAVAELARVTRAGGIHAHQVDFRDHRNFDRPLDHLLLDKDAYHEYRVVSKGVHGTKQRMPEMIEQFSKHFWLWEVEPNTLADLNYVNEIISQLPRDNPYRGWSPQLLRVVSGHLWMVRKSYQGPRSWFRKRSH